MGNVEAADIAQLDSFEVLPEPLARVELRSIGREALQMQTLGGAIGEEVPDDLTAMDWGAIPDEPIRPGTSRSRCSRNPTTSSELIARSWQWK